MKLKVTKEVEITEGDTLKLCSDDGIPNCELQGMFVDGALEVRVCNTYGADCPIMAIMPEAYKDEDLKGLHDGAIRLERGHVPLGWGLEAFLVDVSRCRPQYVRTNDCPSFF